MNTSSLSGLQTDLYELTMAAGYFTNGHNPQATFELYCHTMPENRSYLVACGLEQAIEFITQLRFSDDDIVFLKAQEVFRNVPEGFFDYLRQFRFSGDVWAMEEGEICFANEPLLQVVAPLIEAQILETYLLSIVNIETLVASKAARVVTAASSDGKTRSVIDFGSRRAQGPEAGLLAARAAFIGGCEGTSNVLAGKKFGIPIFGTMAHSWIQAFDSEESAFRNYQRVFPEHTTVLLDTYDTVAAAKKLSKFPGVIRGVRLDSGNLCSLSRKVRQILNDHSLSQVRIVVSGNLNEFKIAKMVAQRCPIDSFGVGTEMVVSRDYPVLDLTYKLVQIETEGGQVKYKLKLSQGKHTTPGRKQVIRFYDSKGFLIKDIIALAEEPFAKGGRPLLKQIIKAGKIMNSLPSSFDIQANVKKNLTTLPPTFLDLNKIQPYGVFYSDRLSRITKDLRGKKSSSRKG
jgi:nicotinate phosphoribosyltransferase